MLAKQNRVVRAADFRAAMRQGRRIPSAHAIVHLRVSDEHGVRFGFVISRAVGNAVARNRTRRRLRAIGGELIAAHAIKGDVVVRVLPGASELEWTALRAEIFAAIERAVSR